MSIVHITAGRSLCIVCGKEYTKYSPKQVHCHSCVVKLRGKKKQTIHKDRPYNR